MRCYNHQSVVDGKYGISCAVKTSDRCDGEEDLFELVDKVKENTGGGHENVKADSAFGGYDVYKKIEQDRPEQFYVPDSRFESAKRGESGNGKFEKSRFEKLDDGSIICPAGLAMVLNEERVEGDHILKIYVSSGCGSCQLREKCTKSGRRRLSVDSREEFRERMRERLRTDLGREIYMKRQGIVEAGHGDDQYNKGWRQHLLRGKAKAALEFMLIRIGSNLKKIATYRSKELLALT